MGRGCWPLRGEVTGSMREEQERAMVFLLREYRKGSPGIEVKGCKEVKHPEEAREDYEPYFDVGKWMSQPKSNGRKVPNY